MYDISEDGKEYRLSIESNIPVPCPEFNQVESDCRISLRLNTVDEGKYYPDSVCVLHFVCLLCFSEYSL